MACRYIGHEQGLFNDMIHGIVKDDKGMLWLSTNKGVIKYDPETQGSYTYYYSRGMEIGEFSDDSYYRCPYTGSIFMGGIDGVTYMDANASTVGEYYPPLILRRLRIAGEAVDMRNYAGEAPHTLRIPEAQNSFSLEFVAPDYLNNDIEYSYRLEGWNDNWSLFAKENSADFRRVPPGRYTFRVRYKKDVFDTLYQELAYTIVVTPAWYHSPGACMVYLLLACLLAGLALRSLWRKGWWEKLKEAFQVLLLPNQPVSDGNDDRQAGDISSFPHCQTEEQRAFAERVTGLVDTYIDQEEMGTTFLAEKMHISPRQFYRRFKELSGITPGDFIKNYKMEKAAHLLRTTSTPIQEIMDAIGISSRSYFYKEFARKYNTTPKLYREEAAGNS